jgi:hypothetical protein
MPENSIVSAQINVPYDIISNISENYSLEENQELEEIEEENEDII